MIIVEGPDGAGKSTTIERLGYTTRMHLKSLRGGVGGMTTEGWAAPTETIENAYLRKLLGAAKAERDKGKTHVAFDRFHLSERVYGPLLRDTQLVQERDLYCLRERLCQLRIPVILCMPKWETTLRNVNQQGRERPAYQTGDFLSRAYAAWEAVAKWADVVYDYETDELPTQFHAD